MRISQIRKLKNGNYEATVYMGDSRVPLFKLCAEKDEIVKCPRHARNSAVEAGLAEEEKDEMGFIPVIRYYKGKSIASNSCLAIYEKDATRAEITRLILVHAQQMLIEFLY